LAKSSSSSSSAVVTAAGGGNRFLLSLYLWLMQEVQTEGWFTFSQNPHTHPLLAIMKPKHPQTKQKKKIIPLTSTICFFPPSPPPPPPSSSSSPSSPHDGYLSVMLAASLVMLFFFLSCFLLSLHEQNHTKKGPNKFQFCILPLLGHLFMTLH
jgi:hypothetical protein